MVSTKSDNPKRFLLLGGTGFLGQNILEGALARNFKVTVLSKNFDPSYEIRDGISRVFVDITNPNDLRDVLKGEKFDYVVNCAGYVNHSSFSNGGKLVYATHFDGLRNLLEVLDLEVIQRFVQIGTSEEYGNVVAPQHEDLAERPITPYGAAKLSATNLLRLLYQSMKFPMVVVRPYLVYGPGQSPNRLIPSIVENSLAGNTFPVTHGNQLRDFLFITDFVNMVFMSIEKESAIGEVFNAGSGQAIRVRAVIEHLVDLIGSGKPEFGSLPVRSTELNNLYPEISKANKLLGWKPSVCLNEGLAQVVTSIQKQKDAIS
ncbi:NAD-dependent epimerase/dehydratase family protein [Alphaproteobacteria bacterium]|nr:NAD-dependent epimerase/dehydratase family protein [Alphaproteobacteria bacterium]